LSSLPDIETQSVAVRSVHFDGTFYIYGRRWRSA
jgi:hypothetical protein